MAGIVVGVVHMIAVVVVLLLPLLFVYCLVKKEE